MQKFRIQTLASVLGVLRIVALCSQHHMIFDVFFLTQFQMVLVENVSCTIACLCLIELLLIEIISKG